MAQDFSDNIQLCVLFGKGLSKMSCVKGVRQFESPMAKCISNSAQPVGQSLPIKDVLCKRGEAI